MGKRRGPHVVGRLTATAVARAKKPGYVADGGNLYLQIADSGAKSWSLRFRVNGRLKEMGLGPIHAVSLAEAREQALKHRKQLSAFRRGESALDPLALRRETKLQATLEAARSKMFRTCAEEYMADRTFRNVKHAKQWPSTLATYAYPILGNVAVKDVDTPMVLSVLRPIWNQKPETASRVRQRIEAILGWATVHGYRAGDNPARWQNHLDKALQQKTDVRKVKHHAALPYRELPEFLVALRQQPGFAARALEFAILTAARTGEVIGAKWSEIDMKERLWIVPAERMKAAREHRVPLSDAAIALLGNPGRPDEFVFAGGKIGAPLSNMALLMTLRRMGRNDLTAHGFRSTFKTWASECTEFPREIIEAALAHTIGGKVEQAYQRSDWVKRRAALATAWARYCSGRSSGDNVLPIRPSAA